MAQLSDDCFAFGGPPLDVADARRLILERISPIAEPETIPLHLANGRILARDVIAPLALPRFDNSAVDGYAVRFADLDPARDTKLRCVERIAAGGAASLGLTAGTAARIFTGAPLPEGADTVLMQEDCVRDGETVTIRPGIKRGANTRRAGEDVAHGARALAQGHRLSPSDLGLLAALGQADVSVRRRLKVSLFSTGDEVLDPGAPLGRSQIYDANRYMLTGLLERRGVIVVDRGIVPDHATSLAAALSAAAGDSDLIVTSGGVSVGEEDHIRAAVAGQGSLHFWRLAIKPGRAVAMGQIGRTPLASLPGNPVAALLTFALVARPMIEVLSGETPHLLRAFKVQSGFDYAKKAGRREYVRVALRDGRAERSPKEGAAMITSLTETDGLAELPPDMTKLSASDTIDFLPYGELI